LNISKGNTSKNIFKKIRCAFKNWGYVKTIKFKEHNFEQEVEMSIGNLVQDYRIKNNRSQFINSYFNEAVKRSASGVLKELERKKTVIDGLNNYIYGAIGEQKVVKTLGALNDDYFLINDFDVSFSKAIYNRHENDYIKSVQIDHVLVGPSGIFLIETKNWSEKSIENLNLRSPVQQIKRTSFALFYLLNSDRSSYQLHLDNHHWGDKKISIKNLIVLTTAKPKGEFQHVKILTLNELLSYVKYFKPVYSSAETKRIAEMILWINK
ncbi:MAG: nuclease-related domain-containing protein, partial [Flavobacterium nitrogenifigens]|uniref:nuclease-related domain-containing protein n=1 Tax=Flavobacterium nitrogenifigens TaxID=1617283 RepID=UPI0028068711